MNSQPTSTEDSPVQCAACGHPNPSWRWECEECKARLASPDRPEVSGLHKRPGCLTAYAILLAIGAASSGIGGIAYGITEKNIGLALGAVVVAGLEFLLALGIWRLKNWARIIMIVLHGLGVLTGLISLFMGNAASLLSLVIGGTILYWFIAHHEYFT